MESQMEMINNKPTKKALQKEILKAYKRGERILDILVEYKRIYNLDDDETKRLVSKQIKEKMFQQEKLHKTVVTKQTRHLQVKPCKKSTIFDLDETTEFC